MADVVGPIENGLWAGLTGLFFNPFFLTIVLVGVFLCILLFFRVTRRGLQWIFGFQGIRILTGIIAAIFIAGMILSGFNSGLQAAGVEQGQTGSTTGCQPAPVTAFPPSNPHDAISMLCATNVATVNGITDATYDGVQLLASEGQVMTATLPANMCIIYQQTALTSFDGSKISIIVNSDSNNIKAKTTAVVKFSSDIGLSVYGTPC